MNCIYCASSTKVTNSRSRANGLQVWRRRECKKCHAIWTTHEAIDPSTTHQVVHADGSAEPLSRDVLFVSLIDSLKHRESAVEDASYLTDTILARILALKSPKVMTSIIIDAAYKALKNFESTAAAVYKAMHV